MDLFGVFNRFAGESFILYGGDRKFFEEVSSRVAVIAWFTENEDATTVPPQISYDNFFHEIYDANYIVVGNGYVGRQKAETAVTRIFRSQRANRARDTQAVSTAPQTPRVIIFHGYPDFIVTGIPVMKETYIGGCIIGPEDDRVTTLQALTTVMDRNVTIPVPLTNVEIIPGIDEILPYIHIVSKIRELKERTGQVQIPITTEMPVDIMVTNDRARQEQYDPTTFTSAINWGQRKLLVSEIELLVQVIERDIARGGDGRGFIIVYVGSAPGSHIPHLLNLFARYGVTAHLWDRRERFDIPESGVIRIIPSELADPAMTGDTEGFFTDVVADNYVRTYGRDNRLIFVSDIRDANEEEAIDRDMQMQRGWVERLNPYASQLKFRLPISNERPYPYLDGDIYTQAWARNKSAESRLLSFSPFRERTYNPGDYDRSFSYFNMNTRVQSYNLGNVVRDIVGSSTATDAIGASILMPDQGLCTCHDCAREVQVIAKYLRLLRFPASENTIRTFVTQNTRASRPYAQQSTNPRTLWTKVAVKMGPYDRRNLILFKELPPNSDLFQEELQALWKQEIARRGVSEQEADSIHVDDHQVRSVIPAATAKILMYADGMSMQEIVDTLLSKKGTSPLIVTSLPAPEIFRNVLKGDRYIIVVNFNTDFEPSLGARGDLGSVGKVWHGRFAQFMDVAQQTASLSVTDEQGALTLFALQSPQYQ